MFQALPVILNLAAISGANRDELLEICGRKGDNKTTGLDSINIICFSRSPINPDRAYSLSYSGCACPRGYFLHHGSGRSLYFCLKLVNLQMDHPPISHVLSRYYEGNVRVGNFQ